MIIDLMGDRADIQRPAAEESTTGEVTEDFTTVAAAVPCSIQPRSGIYRLLEQGEDDEAFYFGVFPWGTDIRIDDHVVFGALTFVVTFVAPIHGHHIEVDLTTRLL